MSIERMMTGKVKQPKYTKHGRAKQSYKDSCDINKLLERGAREGGLSHLEKHGARYGDFAAIDWDTLPMQLAEGRTIFEELPAEIKREFNQSPAEFFAYVTADENKDDLQRLLPAIAERGKFFPKVNKIETRTLDEDQQETVPQNPAPAKPDNKAEKPDETGEK